MIQRLIAWFALASLGSLLIMLTAYGIQLTPFRPHIWDGVHAVIATAGVAFIVVAALLCRRLSRRAWVGTAFRVLTLAAVILYFGWLAAAANAAHYGGALPILSTSFAAAVLAAWSSPIGSTMTANQANADQSVQGASSGNMEQDATADTAVTPPYNLSAVKGMADTKREVQRFIDNVRQPVPTLNGLLLVGPPGTGKTMFARAIAGELKLPLIEITQSVVSSRWIGASQERIAERFAEAKRLGRCVVFLDELDGYGKDRGAENSHNEDKKNVDTLLTCINDARAHGAVVIAATNFPEALDAALVRDRRFDFKIEVPFPDAEACQALLHEFARAEGISFSNDVARGAADYLVRRSAAHIENIVHMLRIDGVARPSLKDVKAVSRRLGMRPSAIPSQALEIEELAMTEDLRNAVKSLAYRMENYEAVLSAGGTPPKGILLYGPPGTGKTSIVRSLAKRLSFHVFEAPTSEILAKPSKMNDLIQLASNHRPAIIFLDEAEDLLQDRSLSNSTVATNEVLKAIDGLQGTIPDVIFIAATNASERIDQAALRSGRFSEHLFVGPLSGNALAHHIDRQLSKIPKGNLGEPVSGQALAHMLHEATPADVQAMISAAINRTFEGGTVRKLRLADFTQSTRNSQSVS